MFLKVVLLAIVQGLAELLPVSSSAHVIVAEKLLGLDPASPPMTLLLVMLHTGTMVAVIVYFWAQWRQTYFSSMPAFKRFAARVIVATLATALVGEAIIKLIEHTLLKGTPKAQIEDLFNHLEFIAPALAAAGLLILIAGFLDRRSGGRSVVASQDIDNRQAGIVGAVQGLCLPFRGFSRSGATISAAMLLGIAKTQAEAFSFALAVVLTPIVVLRELLRLAQSGPGTDGTFNGILLLSVFGAVVAFAAGLLALKWISRWLEGGRWYLFGLYCLVAATAVGLIHSAGY